MLPTSDECGPRENNCNPWRDPSVPSVVELIYRAQSTSYPQVEPNDVPILDPNIPLCDAAPESTTSCDRRH